LILAKNAQLGCGFTATVDRGMRKLPGINLLERSPLMPQLLGFLDRSVQLALVHLIVQVKLASFGMARARIGGRSEPVAVEGQGMVIHQIKLRCFGQTV
jgi:hypothetical protein